MSAVLERGLSPEAIERRKLSIGGSDVLHVTDIQHFYSQHPVFLMADGMAIVPMRSQPPHLLRRAVDAWHVLTGKYDAVSWERIGEVK